MNKFEVSKDIIDNYSGMLYNHYSNGEIIEYVFHNTPIGDRIAIKSQEACTHHQNVFMVLLELEEVQDSTDLWWHNTTYDVKKFKELLTACLHNDYMNEWFPKVTEYIINRELSELNNLIDYTQYWIK